VIWKKKAGKNLPVAVAKELMAKLKESIERGDDPPIGRTEKQVTGFRGRSGRSFRAKLRIEPRGEDAPGRWKVEFDEEWADRPRAEPSEEQEQAAAPQAAAAS
jgi:DNA topoisomerase-3